MEKNKTGKYLKYAIGEIILVVIGILIALQINNWNETRKERQEERDILSDLQLDIRVDIERLNYQLDFKKEMVRNYKNCLEILADKKEATKSEFMEGFKSILQVGDVSLNTTTFNNLQTTGEIRLIKNKTLANSIVNYYNTDLGAWQSALREYTRNITAPYVLNFDYLPQNTFEDSRNNLLTMTGGPEDFKKPGKTLDDYKEDYFIINTLRQKTWNLEALMLRYSDILDQAKNLDKAIQKHLDNQ
ncbi:DUF6090 family protein [uncultured Eudoraea sp.]|jgi:uncharacterized protein YutD|uniref:DUF6090 family protein n=1 Tax=uncultured Eudoraea sp. TaxID=1035614 RepID=UPI00262DC6B4|nr:DUF6090 family protein [uncultured Eudoraea sp.]